MNRERLINEFFNIVKIDSPSKGERKLADYLTRRLIDLGATVCEDDTGGKIGGNCGNLIAKIPGNPDYIAPILFSDMDTVPPCGNIRPQIRGGKVFSSGDTVLGADDGAGIACILETLENLERRNIPHGDICIVFTVCEEVSLMGSTNLNKNTISGDFALALDSTGPAGGIVIVAPAHCNMKIVIHGKASHAGVEPEKGISVMQIFAYAVNRMKLGRIDADTTANIGVVKGGSAVNIVCDKMEILAEARSIKLDKLDAQIEHMKFCFQQACDFFRGSMDFSVDMLYAPITIDTRHELIGRLQKAAQQTGIEMRMEKSGGGSDANILNMLGFACVNLSIGVENVHSVQENVSIKEMCATVEWLTAFCSQQR